MSLDRLNLKSARAFVFCAGTILVALAACGKPSAHRAAAAASPAAAAAVVTKAVQPADGAPDLLSLAAGAFPIETPESAPWHTGRDLLGGGGWTSPPKAAAPAKFVIALPQRTVLNTLSFDGGGIGSAKDVVVEISDQGPDAGYVEIARGSLDEYAKNQALALEHSAPGRFVRVTINSDYDPEGRYWMSLGGLHATGQQLSSDGQPEVSGTFVSDEGHGDLGRLHFRQQGTAFTGCLDKPNRTFEGSIENRTAQVSWCTHCDGSDKDDEKGHAVFVFSPKADRLVGIAWSKAEPQRPDPTNGFYAGGRIAGEVGTCPKWSGGIEQQLASDLKEFGRAAVHGVNFDVDSDVIKADSKPLLDHIATMLKAHSDWRIDIEGHTDSTSTHEHNQTLSERRAASVKAYLVTAGVAADHLGSKGFGDSKPIADNESDLGRAQNRRVELVKE
jgi:outer membrane protein OmpA-like peptidoglycan-associated protein